jgi:hypothetical protein
VSQQEWDTIFGPRQHRRSWPAEPTRLEVIATRANLSDEELRSHLTSEIQQRRRARGEAWDKLDSTLEERERRRNGA